MLERPSSWLLPSRSTTAMRVFPVISLPVWSPSPVGAPTLIRLNRQLASELSLDAHGSRARTVSICWRADGSRRRPTLSPPPMPATSSASSCRNSAMAAPSCWARSIDREGRASRHPAQGRRPNAVFARRRRPCRAGASASRVHRQRGNGGARHPHHARAGGGTDRRHGAPGGPAARRDPHPCRGEPYPRRHLPVLRRARRHAGGARSRRPCHRQALSGGGDVVEALSALLEAVIAAQADLVARWLTVGFIHGVMNTDNTSIAGETIDYGPCAFMDAYHPGAVFSSIDETGPLCLCEPTAHRALESRRASRRPCCRCLAIARRARLRQRARR